TFFRLGPHFYPATSDPTDRSGPTSRGTRPPLGRKRTFHFSNAISAFPPKAGIRWRGRHVRFVPKADIGLLLLDRARQASVSSIDQGGREGRYKYCFIRAF